jgi:hypothetical protein
VIRVQQQVANSPLNLGPYWKRKKDLLQSLNQKVSPCSKFAIFLMIHFQDFESFNQPTSRHSICSIDVPELIGRVALGPLEEKYKIDNGSAGCRGYELDDTSICQLSQKSSAGKLLSQSKSLVNQ